jgi:ElaB/YqjD/DUF883 family membrane-anchored ribosome-binding protein
MESQTYAGTENFKGGNNKMAKEVGGVVDEAVTMMKDYGAQTIQSAKATLSHAQTVVKDNARQYAHRTDEYVHANPWKVLGVAAAAGMLIGFLLSRR